MSGSTGEAKTQMLPPIILNLLHRCAQYHSLGRRRRRRRRSRDTAPQNPSRIPLN